MYRKTSFGTQSEEGSRFVERIFTATTLKLQGRDVLAFLTETLAASPPRLYLNSRSLPELVNG